MIICLCRNKTDRDVSRATDAGASSLGDLQSCGIGTDCGSCHSFLRRMLAGAHATAATKSVCACQSDLAAARA